MKTTAVATPGKEYDDTVEEAPLPELTLEAGRVEQQYWRDLWRYRELFYFLAWRDVLVRYKQTTIGIAWALVRPVATMIVFTVVFGRLAKLPSGDTPYPLLVYTAMLPWQFFASTLSECSNSLITNAPLLTKVYFPRLIIPASSIVVCFIDFLISAAILVVLMLYYRFVPSWHVVFLPLFVISASLASAAAGLWLATLNVKYRDFRYIVPFIVQFGLYISPVGFSSTIVPERWRLLYGLNPMVGVIDGFRWCILGGSGSFDWGTFLVSTAIASILLVSGVRYFRQVERSFADTI